MLPLVRLCGETALRSAVCAPTNIRKGTSSPGKKKQVSRLHSVRRLVSEGLSSAIVEVRNLHRPVNATAALTSATYARRNFYLVLEVCLPRKGTQKPLCRHCCCVFQRTLPTSTSTATAAALLLPPQQPGEPFHETR